MADDHVIFRAGLRKLLETEDDIKIVGEASNGNECLDMLTKLKPDILLLDLRMPQFDGFSVLDFLKANQPDMLHRVLVVTAVLTRKELERAKSYGVCGIITKPFDIDVLLDAVKDCAGDRGTLGPTVFCSPVILLIADLLRQKMSF